jgi:hypothetical protein
LPWQGAYLSKVALAAPARRLAMATNCEFGAAIMAGNNRSLTLAAPRIPQFNFVSDVIFAF